MTREQQIELCKVYNNSDIESFEYMKSFCDDKQLELLDRLVTLNMETTIGFGREDYTTEELDEYYKGKWELLSSFGIENNGGDAYFEGKFYQ